MPSIDELCSKVSATAMFAHLEEFAKRVKLSGTPEELESFHYLQAELDEIGFSTALIGHDAYIIPTAPPRDSRGIPWFGLS